MGRRDTGRRQIDTLVERTQNLSIESIVNRAQNFPRRLAYDALTELGKRVNYGTNIYDRKWDVLVVLDACRFDLFREFAPRHDVYDRFDTVEPIYSCSSATQEWLEKTFIDGPRTQTKQTHYVTCTGFSTNIPEGAVHQIDEVWRYGVDPEYRVTRPEAVTDAAIDAARTTDAKRLVVHYVQPHAPFLHCVGKYGSRGDGGEGGTQNVWLGLSDGRFDREEVWEDYGQNLLRVLDEVETLIDNVDGKVVITSDHGNAMGEFGFHGHPIYIPHPVVKRVPWAEARGADSGEYEVQGVEAISTGLNEQTLHENLSALGYV